MVARPINRKYTYQKTGSAVGWARTSKQHRAHMTAFFDFGQAPGHLIRRAQQIAVAEFTRCAAELGVTPVQFAFMNAMLQSPGLDQVTLAQRVAFDPATSGSVIGRLEAKGWVQRRADPQDRRRKLLYLTPEGEQALAGMHAPVAQAQASILAPLPPADRATFMRLLTRLVAGHGSSGEPG